MQTFPDDAPTDEEGIVIEDGWVKIVRWDQIGGAWPLRSYPAHVVSSVFHE